MGRKARILFLRNLSNAIRYGQRGVRPLPLTRHASPRLNTLGATTVGITSIGELFPNAGNSGLPQDPEDHMRRELEILARELKQVHAEIEALKATVYGLSVIYGPEAVGQEFLETVRPARTERRRGLAEACRSVLKGALRPLSVAEICAHLHAIDPELLVHHRNPMASVMSILRSLARRGEAVRGIENGRSVWEWASRMRPVEQNLPSTGQEYFQ